jgi:hypothetical protein
MVVGETRALRGRGAVHVDNQQTKRIQGGKAGFPNNRSTNYETEVTKKNGGENKS